MNKLLKWFTLLYSQTEHKIKINCQQKGQAFSRYRFLAKLKQFEMCGYFRIYEWEAAEWS